MTATRTGVIAESPLVQRTRASAQVFQAPARKRDGLAFTVLGVLVVGLDAAIGDGFNGLHDVIGARYALDELPVFRLEQLQERPDGDVLEGCVAAHYETVQVASNAAVRLCPVFAENGIIANFGGKLAIRCIYIIIKSLLTFRRQVSQRGSTVALYFNTLRFGQRNKNVKNSQVEQVRFQLVAER